MSTPAEPSSSPPPLPEPSDSPTPVSLPTKVRKLVVGRPHDLRDRSIYHQLSLAAFLAWVGLGADGLSSSSYGPEEAFRTVQQHAYLAVGLAVATALTVLIISAAYSRIIEQFPHGGGGYAVATKLLGPRWGLVSGCALLVDYVLTITISIAAAGDAFFSFIPPEWAAWKLPGEAAIIFGLTAINIRGVRESVMVLTPIFLLFLATHAYLIGYGIFSHLPQVSETAKGVADGFQAGHATLGTLGMLALFVHAFSLGGGTYTGIEAVSNALPIMREPRVATAKRTMIYMALSLAITAAGLLLCYLLWNVVPAEGKTMNAVLAELVAERSGLGHTFAVVTLFSEGALLVVAAQAGLMGGPRVLANLALDSWAPRRFASLSERLTTENGILLMGLASLLALFYTGGDVHHIVVMYSINVFLTFALAMFGMTRHWVRVPAGTPQRKRRIVLFVTSLALCFTILAITVVEKFDQGGWVTLVVTGGAVMLCFLIRRHYREVYAKLARLYAELGRLPVRPDAVRKELQPKEPTAAVLVGAYGGLGIHTVLGVFKTFPNYFKNVVFISAGVVDTGLFKGEDTLDDLESSTKGMLQKYVDLAASLGVPATYRTAVGTDVVDELERLCIEVSHEFQRTTFFAGEIIFANQKWYHRILHNETAFAVQHRLHWGGRTVVILPARVQD